MTSPVFKTPLGARSTTRELVGVEIRRTVIEDTPALFGPCAGRPAVWALLTASLPPRAKPTYAASTLSRLFDERLDEGLDLFTIDGIAGAGRARRSGDGHHNLPDAIALVLLTP